ncbi:hypothetical protein HII36_17210 [Nonomuraea sp. NN258]|uniref:hypothetical protein n=1 Tax=Nonomuraea antri TaxID=2730852 RepID=UPI0015687645|nr:hypothetical protein [Nonomuraea antri]NRQ33576.1 hypothetical protein [Nonomuraea antri]
MEIAVSSDSSVEVFGADIVINGGTGPLEVRGFSGAIEGTTHSTDVKVRFTVGANDLVQAAGEAPCPLLTLAGRARPRKQVSRRR